ncbi:MAG: 3-oxoacyl-[acyl-carrier-protein] reductase [Leptospirales bacterium]|nr:3-oxoacyl-[acyl-carrier-protein] reductase [Leptospirales bacterium]
MSINFSGKAAVVTGSARGIGKAIAHKLATLGADIVISDINAEQAAAAAQELATATGRKVISHAGDISKADQADALIEACVKEFGHVDILVNNAGITKDTLLMRMKPEQWDAVIAVNLTGTFNCTQPAFKQMMKQKSGAIVNISSIAKDGNMGQTNYSASKAGVVGFTKSVALEGASRGIRCNAIAPGFIKTDMTDAIPEAIRLRMAKMIPLQRAGLPEDIANGVAFLCSDMASFITGHVLDINGGGFQPASAD